MKPIIFENHPGFLADLAAAEQAANDQRILPYLDHVDVLLGIDVKLLTPRHYVKLDAARSPFILGGDPEPEHVALFLWVISTSFSTVKRARTAFLRKIAKSVDYFEAVPAIREYVGASFEDNPASDEVGRQSNPIVSTPASIVHALATAYGWSKDDCLDTPYLEIWQYLKLIDRDAHHRHGKKYVGLSRARMRVQRKWLPIVLEGGRV